VQNLLKERVELPVSRRGSLPDAKPVDPPREHPGTFPEEGGQFFTQILRDPVLDLVSELSGPEPLMNCGLDYGAHLGLEAGQEEIPDVAQQVFQEFAGCHHISEACLGKRRSSLRE